MKIIRLVSIIALLLRKEKVQAKELADLFEVSVRTILRDIDTIDQAGLPIVTYQGSGGGIGLAEGFRIDKSVLTSDEISAIIASLNVQSFSSTNVTNDVLVEKFKNILKEDQLKEIEEESKQLFIDHKPWFESDVLKSLREDIQHQIKNRQMIVIEYKPFDGQSTHRTIEPYSLIYKNQKWYVYGYCHERNDFRLFKLQRIKNIQFTHDIFEPREFSIEDLSFSNKWNKNAQKETIVLSFEPFMLDIIEELFNPETKIEKNEHKIIVTYDYEITHMLMGYILSFGDTVEVLSPQKLRDDILNISQNISKKYL